MDSNYYIKLLYQNNIFSKELSQKMQNWVGLRNLLTHIYEDVEDARIFSFIENDLKDFDDLISLINQLKK